MTKQNTDNGNETKSDIFPWTIFTSDFISHWPINIQNMQQPLFFSSLKKPSMKTKHIVNIDLFNNSAEKMRPLIFLVFSQYGFACKYGIILPISTYN